MINICSVYWKQNLISNSILPLSIYQVKKYVLPSPIILNWPNFSLHRPYVGYYNNWLLVEQRCDHWVTKLAWLRFCNPQRISWQRNTTKKVSFCLKYLCSMKSNPNRPFVRLSCKLGDPKADSTSLRFGTFFKGFTAESKTNRSLGSVWSKINTFHMGLVFRKIIPRPHLV